jgi:hypothetical protein
MIIYVELWTVGRLMFQEILLNHKTYSQTKIERKKTLFSFSSFNKFLFY